MSLIQPSTQPKVSQKASGRRNENNKLYANPLPIIFAEEQSSAGVWHKALGLLLGVSLTRVLNPHCEGVFDATTRSVWVTDMKHAMTLWQRGFFGKGDLSRSEPSWLARQINARKQARTGLTSEEVTAKRRAERKQFKLDRAKAMAAAAAEAEAAFREEGRVISTVYSADGTRIIPSAATWKPSQTLPEPPRASSPTESEDEDDNDVPIENVEHLQLTLSEAFFLLWNLDCLSVTHPETGDALSLNQIWCAFQNAHVPSPSLSPNLDPPARRFDNPFLVNYVAYHHYKSLGWVVKNGIKFCVDYLLYKRGPVFSHAEFAIVVCPVYEDPADQESSPFQLQNTSPFSWSWLSTLNRVNAQVQKTLILSYVTIPARSRVPDTVLSSPACFNHYSVREVIVRRFIPARMRD
ncbi:hypothetical protein BKA82DRAFT_135733 [Pisolithus tinctorius]|uniref:tRNA-splicing endonuclease subunit Sen2 n=1 Tax=Pisolithus tinctorius Marx 270 TaxID=870435 RepID=A0A0C3PI66_PISTI|nr:hypothetical protein BKA82DRAFT_135733 [Pisolithus tinctorius]KIO07754.1 hypothetical protein M404DRAFT_135733 [Pisolithus tinctorius Marx 270]